MVSPLILSIFGGQNRGPYLPLPIVTHLRIGLLKGLPDAGYEVVLSGPLLALHLEHRTGLTLGDEQISQDRHCGLL